MFKASFTPRLCRDFNARLFEVVNILLNLMLAAFSASVDGCEFTLWALLMSYGQPYEKGVLFSISYLNRIELLGVGGIEND